MSQLYNQSIYMHESNKEQSDAKKTLIAHGIYVDIYTKIKSLTQYEDYWLHLLAHPITEH